MLHGKWCRDLRYRAGGCVPAGAPLERIIAPKHTQKCLRQDVIRHLDPLGEQQQQQYCSSSRWPLPLSIVAAVAVVPLLLWPSIADAKLPPIKDPASNVGYLTNKEVDKRRKKASFVRGYDGHVSIQNKYTKAWTDVKCDLQVPGLLLLRDASGEVFYLGYGGLKQVDLSDDIVVAAIASDDWENAMIPVEGPGESGAIERLEMTREGFYQLVSLTSGEDFEAELQEAEPAAVKK